MGSEDASRRDGALHQTRQLFARLAEIKSLQREARETENPDLLRRALELVSEHTYDARWYDEILVQYRAHAGEPPVRRVYAQDAEASPQVRIERARETGSALVLGNMYVRHGLYRDALMAYNTSGEHRLECVANLNILQENWSFVQSNIGKVLALDKLSNVLLLHLALAHWKLGEYGEALAVLLWLNPDQPVCSVWLSEAQIWGMLLVSALVAFERSTLQFFARTDPVLLSLETRCGEHSQKLVGSYLGVDLEVFWAEMRRLHVPPVGADVLVDQHPVHVLRARLQRYWLYLHSQVQLEAVLAAFKIGRGAEYTVIDLLDDLQRWEAPYKVDAVLGVVKAHDPEPDNAAAAEALARWFKRDTLILLWQRQVARNA